jgi:hypothetical protein
MMIDAYEAWCERSEELWKERAQMKQQCVWCGAISEPNAERMEGESVPEILERRLGPRGCCAPDGDGHLWKVYHGTPGSREKGGMR